MGWDDNGLNVERRVQLMRGVICDPSLPYDPNFRPSDPPPKNPIPVSRPNFLNLCAEVTELLEKKYHDLWSSLGLSVDWTLTYRTIGSSARKTSQTGFLHLYEDGLAYRAEAPTLWDVDFKTAVAQAELQERMVAGAYHKLRFYTADGRQPILIDTTRPELLAACVALVAHPDDPRYRHLFGTDAITPLFQVRVPIKAHPLADPEKGTGIAMVCTFGDTTDVTWWRELSLPVRSTIERNGTLARIRFGDKGWESEDPAAAQQAYDQFAGRSIKQAAQRIVDLLRESHELQGEPRPIEHPVKFWENGVRALEIVTSAQWFVKYPPKDVLLARGRELKWWPEFTRIRYEDWVNGLTGDWNITRQRFFGVPFPVWYPIDEKGVIHSDQPILAQPHQLPVDPSSDVPPGYNPEQRDKPGGFAGDTDVMDTWATSSLTPQIVSGWVDDPDLFQRVFPMELRPQAHEIIRTWLFYSIVRSHYEHNSLPWRNAAISGFVTDPDRKKLSKSAGNAPDDPPKLINEFGADAVRYWAAGGRPGMDVAFSRDVFKVGRRLATKILNASRFALGFELLEEGLPTEAVDLSILAQLANVAGQATRAFESYDYTRALERTETFFWFFCDNYLELVKDRAYTKDKSALATLRISLSVLLRLFAPFTPFVTEEVWSWWQSGSVHRAPWPDESELSAYQGDVRVMEVAAAILSEVRKAKSDAKLSMKAPVESIIIRGGIQDISLLKKMERDLIAAGNIETINVETTESDLSIETRLAVSPR